MKNIATIILNRNLPEPTDKLYEHLVKYDGEETDVYVLEAGSDKKNLSQYCTWHANTDEIIKEGLRYCRGMNYGLLQLWKEKKWEQYDYFFLLTNDTELSSTQTLAPMKNLLKEHKRVGILSPCSARWGERLLLQKAETKYFWFIHNNALLLRRNFIESVMEKAYANNWAASITAKVFAEENESYLLNKADLIRTESYDENIRLYIKEGEYWLRRKYGFNSRWSMQQYVKSFYDSFFDFYPEYKKYKL
jgi:hypothetical protein